MNNDPTSKNIAHMAAELMRDPSAPEFEKSLAGSALALAHENWHSSPEMDAKAKEVMDNKIKYSKKAVELAEAVLAHPAK